MIQEVVRWDPTSYVFMSKDPTGEYVLYEDYAKLQKRFKKVETVLLQKLYDAQHAKR